MNSYGLGLVLNFVDNASAGMQRASSTFQQMNGMADNLVNSSSSAATAISALSFAGYSLSTLGNGLVSVGSKVTGFFSNFINGVDAVGGQIYSARMQLTALYGGEAEGEEMLNKIQSYAKKSIFSFESLIPAVISLKAVGVDAFQDITTTSGSATQSLLNYASDLASFKPAMRNAYGTGINASIGAIQEYIAEGNKMSLKRGAGLDITSILGQDVGATMEERTQQIADLIEKLNMLGITESQAGTPANMISNLGDIWFQFKQKISDNGVYGAYTAFLAKVYDYINAIPEDEMKSIAKTISDSLVSLMEPVTKFLDYGIKLLDWIRQTTKENPKLVQTIIKVVAVAGALLVGAGYASKFGGSIFFAMSAIRAFTGSNGSLITDLLNIKEIFSSATLTILPLVALAGILYIAWTENIGGFRDYAKQAFNDILSYIPLLVDGWDGSMSEDNFKKARDLGILPFIESIQQIKYHWGFLVEGFKQGIRDILSGFGEVLAEFGISNVTIKDMLDGATSLIDVLTAPGTEKTWKEVGKNLAYVATILAVIVPLVKVFSAIGGAVGIVTKVAPKFISIISAISGGIGTVIQAITLLSNPAIAATASSQALALSEVFYAIWSFFVDAGAWFSTVLVPAITAAGQAIGGALVAVAGFFGLPVWAVVAIIAVIIALIATVVIFRKQIWSEMQFIAGFVKNLFDNLVGYIVMSLKTSPVGAFIMRVFGIVMGVVGSVTNVWKSLFSFISSCASGAFKFYKAVFDGIAKVVRSWMNAVVSYVKTVWKVISSIGNFLFQLVRVVVLAIMLSAKAIYEEGIKPLIDKIVEVANWLWTNITKPFIDLLIQGWQSIVDFVMPILEGIGGYFQYMTDNATTAINTLRDVFVGIWSAITDAATVFFDFIAEKFEWVSSNLNAFGTWFSNGANSASSKVGQVGDYLQSAIGLSTGGYVKTSGIAMLHPNEVVVNAGMTKSLGNLLDDYENDKPKNTLAKVGNRSGSTTTHTYDQSVTFLPSSVVVQIANASDEELERAATILMKKIERKNQLKNMAVRKS